MEYRRLGKSGLKISVLSFGSWVTFGSQVDESNARDMLSVAYERGVNFFDNAEVYAGGESERIMGAALKKLGWGRDTYTVSSKVFWGGERPTQSGLSRKHVTDACHAALKRLQVDYLDLFFCHRPDLHTPIEETVRVMNDLIHQGKVLYWGTSEWNAQQLSEAWAVARENHLIGPTMDQPQYNVFHRARVESELLPLYESYGLGTTIWSPLSSGLLSGKYAAGIPKDSRANVPGYEWLKTRFNSAEGHAQIDKAKQLTPIAEGLGVSLAQLAIAWCARNPHVSTVILGASKRAQLEENLKAIDTIPRLTPEILTRIEQVLGNRPEGPEDFT